MRPLHRVFRLLGRLVVALMLAVIDLLNRLGDLLMWMFVRPPAGVPWRPVSGTERIWLAWNRVQPFVIQYVVEGRLEDGAEIDVERMQRALDRVAESQPGMRMRLGGARSWLHWIADGPKPRLRVVSGDGWDGSSSDGAAFLCEPLDPVRGPVAEVLVVMGDPQILHALPEADCPPQQQGAVAAVAVGTGDSLGQGYVRFVFRALHAVTDGAGCMLFVQGFFSALRDEELTEVNAGPPIDADVGRKFCPLKPPPGEPPAPVLVNPVAEPTEEEAWARVRLAGGIEKAVARVGIALAESALVPVDKSLVRYAVPVDLRRLARVPPSSANLTGVIRLDLAGPFRSEDPVKELDRDIIRTLARREFGADPVRAHRLLRLVSLKRLSRRARRRGDSTSNKCTTTATLSYMGGLRIAEFSGGGFFATSVFSVPPTAPFGRLFLGLVQTDAALEIVAHHPGSRHMSGQLRQLLDAVVRRLGEES